MRASINRDLRTSRRRIDRRPDPFGLLAAGEPQ